MEAMRVHDALLRCQFQYQLENDRRAENITPRKQFHQIPWLCHFSDFRQNGVRNSDHWVVTIKRLVPVDRLQNDGACVPEDRS